jgi:proline dehydrogenase
MGNYTAIATHDPSIIDDMKRFTTQSQIPRDQFEFQLLYGVRRDLQKSLAQEGYTVRAYIPYGKDWYAYFSRRIAERPSNALFVLRGMLQG